jgi:hypothetical protein
VEGIKYSIFNVTVPSLQFSSHSDYLIGIPLQLYSQQTAPQFIGHTTRYKMVRFWRDIHRWVSRNFQPTYDKLYDEERLEQESGLWWRQRQQKSWPAWPRKATVYLLLIDMVIVVLLLQALEPLITLLLRNEELFSSQVTLSSLISHILAMKQPK